MKAINQSHTLRVFQVMLLVATLVIVTVEYAAGQTTYVWQPGSALWHQSGSWSPGGGPPGQDDTALFNSGTTGTDLIKWDSLTGDQSIDQFHVSKGDYKIENIEGIPFSLLLGSSNSDAFSVSGPQTSLTLEGMDVIARFGGAEINDGGTLNMGVGAGVPSLLQVDGYLHNNGIINMQGGVIKSANGNIGVDAGDTGIANIQGVGTKWETSGSMLIGNEGTGTLEISGGALVSSEGGFVGYRNQGHGTLNVSGEGSVWDARTGPNGGTILVGRYGTGVVNVVDKSSIFSRVLRVGEYATGTMTIDDAYVESNHHTWIGRYGDGTLNVQGGGVLSSNGDEGSSIASSAASTGMVEVTGTGSQWNNAAGLYIGGREFQSGGNGTLSILDKGAVTVDGRTKLWDTGRLTINGGSLVTNGFDNSAGGTLEFFDGSLEVTGAGNRLNTGSSFDIDGQTVSDRPTLIFSDQATAQLTYLEVGVHNRGNLVVKDKASIRSTVGYIASEVGSTGHAVVENSDSLWDLSRLDVGRRGAGTLVVSDGGQVVASHSLNIGLSGEDANGNVNVSGAGSQINANRLNVGNGISSGELSIGIGGTVTAAEINIDNVGVIHLNGGHLGFGQMSLDEFSRINVNSGSVAGNFDHSGFSNLTYLSPFQNSAGDLSGITMTNSGTLYGAATNIGNSLINTANGELFTQSGEVVQFRGSAENSGEINNLGGVVRFDQTITNHSGGFIGGRGSFEATQGWSNSGVMAFSDNADLFGDVEILTGGQLITSGDSTTTFYDDVVHNGAEIRTSTDSETVFFGEFTGAGAFTGNGSVYFEGDLRPGNSPDTLFFEGDVVLGSTVYSEFELAGYEAGEFDQLWIEGDLSIDGELSVSLLDGFRLQHGDEFLIANVDGLRTGTFNGLGEGELVGRYSGIDLYISYEAGDGNDVRLFSSVPEPGGLPLLVAVLGFLSARRRVAS